MSTVLIVDDEKNYLVVLEDLLLDEGYEVLTASSVADALKIIQTQPVDTVLSDIKMPGMSGIDLLDKINNLDSELPVILMTAYAEVDQAVSAMKKGAIDHIQKPFDNNAVKEAVSRGIKKRTLDNSKRILSSDGGSLWGNIIGNSEPMQRVFSLARRVSDTPTTVLVSGESGTGKELIAKGIHTSGPRKDQPFISLNCAAVSESLLESEMFGYEKGAFTGANAVRMGKFEAADKGTLFLDEVADMSLNLQAKLLRVLQEQEFQRVGGNKDIKVDVRIIAATNKHLKEEVDSARFRGDLYFRLKVVHIQLPPLRDRSSDIPLLIAHFLEKYSNRLKRDVCDVDPGVMNALANYTWPGNVRELEHVIERAMVLCNGNKITLADLPSEVRTAPLQIPNTTLSHDKSLAETLEEIEEKIIKDALSKAGNIQAQAAKSLGIPRSNLQYKMKKYGLL